MSMQMAVGFVFLTSACEANNDEVERKSHLGGRPVADVALVACKTRYQSVSLDVTFRLLQDTRS